MTYYYTYEGRRRTRCGYPKPEILYEDPIYEYEVEREHLQEEEEYIYGNFSYPLQTSGSEKTERNPPYFVRSDNFFEEVYADESDGSSGRGNKKEVVRRSPRRKPLGKRIRGRIKRKKLGVARGTEVTGGHASGIDSSKFPVGHAMKPERDDSSSRVLEVSSASIANVKPRRTPSVTNVKSIVDARTTSGEVVGWKKPSVPDTTTESTLNMSFNSNEIKRTTSSECGTNVTINSDEYREFIRQINRMPSQAKDGGDKVDTPPSGGIGSLLKSFYDSTNTSTKVPELSLTNRTPVKEFRSANRNLHERCLCEGVYREGVKVNPLREVPLTHLFRWAMSDENLAKARKKSQDLCNKNSSVLLRAFRFLINVIGKVQAIAFRYALRYILFI